MSRKYTLEEVKQEFIKRGYKPLFDEYKNNKQKLLYKCPEHPNEELKIRLNDLKSGYGCPYCARNVKLSLEEVKNEFIKRGYIPLFETYQNVGTPLKFRCPKHAEKENKISVDSLKRGSGCSFCGYEESGKKQKTSLEIVKQEFIKRGYIPLFNEYKGSKYHLQYQCLNHSNKINKISLNNLKKGHGCPYCALEKTQSNGCDKIEFFLNNNSLEYQKEYRNNNCKDKTSLPFDFLIFLNNNLKLLIEFDGEHHYKPVAFGGTSKEQAQKEFELTQKRDAIKNKFCEDNNIPLLRIPYWEEKNIEKILTEKLTELGILNNIA